MARERREGDEAHRFRLVRVATLQDMRAHVGTTVHYDLVDWSKARASVSALPACHRIAAVRVAVLHPTPAPGLVPPDEQSALVEGA